MAKELRIYGGFYSYTADYFMEQLQEAKGQPVTLRINSDGGNPQDSFGMISAWQEFKGKKLLKVDGRAYSTAAFFLCYSDYCEALDVSEFLIHRAAYASWYEKSEFITPQEWESLEKMNKHLRTALEAKIDVKKFEKLKGVTIDQLFSKDTRIDVKLTADEALEIGLIDRINAITPQISAEINAMTLQIAANYNVQAQADPGQKEKSNNKTMTLAELKAQHPALYAEVIAEGKTSAVAEERARVKGWESFRSIDAEAVNKGIQGGQMITANDIAEFTAKALSPEALKKLSAEAPKPVTTTEVTEVAKTDKQKTVEAFEAEAAKNLGIKL